MPKTRIWRCKKDNFVLKQNFDVAQKVIWFWQKRVDVAWKSISYQQKKVEVAQKCISCRQKQNMMHQKIILRTKKFFFLRNSVPQDPAHCSCSITNKLCSFILAFFYFQISYLAFVFVKLSIQFFIRRRTSAPKNILP